MMCHIQLVEEVLHIFAAKETNLAHSRLSLSLPLAIGKAGLGMDLNFWESHVL